MKQIFCAAAVATMIAFPMSTWAQSAEQPETNEETVEATVPARPDDQEGTLQASDGMAECASILAVASTASNNFIQRKNMENAAGVWFAASGDLASQEGEMPDDTAWETKVENWAGRIGSVDGMTAKTDWMDYCSHVGAQHGLDTSHFSTTQ